MLGVVALLTDSAMILVSELGPLSRQEAHLGRDVMPTRHASPDSRLCALAERFAIHIF